MWNVKLKLKQRIPVQFFKKQYQFTLCTVERFFGTGTKKKAVNIDDQPLLETNNLIVRPLVHFNYVKRPGRTQPEPT